MSSNRFDLDAGALCLDFANTANWHASEQPVERLNDIADLIRWGEAAGLLAPDEGQQLRERAGQQPLAAEAVLRQAIQLREAIYRIFANHAESAAVDEADLAILNATLRQALARRQIISKGVGFEWDWAGDGPEWAQIAWSVSRSAAELLTSDRLERVRQCADDRGCGYLFIDQSRNRSRRWCSMESCGNRAKARRHYRKMTAEG